MSRISTEEQKAKNRERCKRWRERHPEAAEQRKALAREWYAKHPNYRREYYLKHREEAIVRAALWHKNNADKARAYQAAYKERRKAHYADYFRDRILRRKYGLSSADVRQMLVDQAFKCAICGQEIDELSLNVDHDHGTGKVRELLCAPCNRGLGDFFDDAAVLERALSYIRKHSAPQSRRNVL